MTYHWQFIIAAYVIGVGGTLALTAWSWVAMRQAETEADNLRRDREA